MGPVGGVTVVIGGDHPRRLLRARSSGPRVFGPDDTRFLEAVAHVLAGAIEPAEAEDALRVAHHEERRLRQRLEAYGRRAARAQEAERRLIARELHDEVGQILTGLMFTLEQLEDQPSGIRASRLDRARVLVGELLNKVPDHSLDLRPPVLDDLGLGPALLWLVERFTAQTGVGVSFTHAGLATRLSADVEIAAYRIAQEALTNVARHAGIKRATLDCVLESHTLVIEVVDKGSGFNSEGPSGGVGSGLVGLEERARANGGHLRVETRPGCGTRVVAELPVGAGRDGQP